MKHLVYSRTKLTEVEEKDIQPNAIDLRLGKVFRINNEAMFSLSETEKNHRGSEEVLPDKDGWYTLYPGQYEVIMKNIIHVGDGEAGWVITRSTLNRNGVFLTSGLYDSGYNGMMAGVLHCSGPVRIQQGTRIGQYLCFEADMVHAYDGSYGLASDHDQKYL